MKAIYSCLKAICLFSFLLIGAKSWAQPVISSFTPASGAVGSSVTISGSGFNATKSNNVVFFGATKATVTAASTSSLTVAVPSGATYSYISVTNLVTYLTANSLKPFNTTFKGDSAIYGALITLQATYYSMQVIMQDMDGDGKADLIKNIHNMDSVSIFRNLGSGNFASVNVKIGYWAAYSLGAADIDGDGKPELVTVNNTNNSVSVLRNTSSPGTLSFAGRVDMSTPSNPVAVAIGDIDGDGRPELAVACQGADSVSVFRNTSSSGTVSFAARQNLLAGTDPYDLCIGDADMDGKADLAIVNYASNTISVLRNTSSSGSVSFASKADFTISGGARKMVMGDLDGDGKMDLAAACIQGKISLLLNNSSGAGTVSFATKVDLNSAYATCLALADVTTDGKADLVVSGDNDSVSVFVNTSVSGTLSFINGAKVAGTQNPVAISIGDMNGDEMPDIALCYGGQYILYGRIAPPMISSFSPSSGATGSSVTINGSGFDSTTTDNIVFFGATKATVTAASTSSLTVTLPAGATYKNISVTNSNNNLTGFSSKPFISTLSHGSTVFSSKTDMMMTNNNSKAYTTAIADLDGDGKADIISSSNQYMDSVSVLRNTGSGTYAARQTFFAGYSLRSLVSGDIDGDGKTDIVVTSTYNDTISILRNTSSSGSISFASPVYIWTGGYDPYTLAIGDIDGNGKTDLVMAAYNSSLLTFLRNTSSPGSISFVSRLLNFSSSIISMAIADLDGDGKPELVLNNNAVYVYRNTSIIDSIIFNNSPTSLTIGSAAQAFAIGDLDLDGKPDIAVTNSANKVSLFRNTSTTGSLSFATKVDVSTSTSPRGLAIGDITGDGKPDLAVACLCDTVCILSNASSSGTLSFPGRLDMLSGSDPISICIGDLDGNKGPDLVTANSGTYTISVFYNFPYAPVVSSFSPAKGAVGSSVTISGSYFNTSTSENAVYFGATRASVTAASATSLIVTVPAGSTYEYISVTNLASNLADYSSKPFVVTFPGNGSALLGPKLDLTAGTDPLASAIADVNEDGKADLIAGNFNSNAVSVFKNTSGNGSLSFATKTDISLGSGIVVRDLITGDLNSDGKADIAFLQGNTMTVSVLTNTSGGGSISFASKLDFTPASGANIYRMDVGDIDGDGKPDLILTNIYSISVLRNTTMGGNSISFAAPVDISLGTSNSVTELTIGDLDADGKVDVAFLCSGKVSVLRNTSTPGSVSFATKVDATVGSGPYALCIGDIDGDGSPDIVTSNSTGSNISVLRNTSTSGSISFATKVDAIVGSGTRSLSLSDLDGDGKVDVAVNQSAALSFFLNTSVSGSISFAARIDQSIGTTQPWSLVTGDLDGDSRPDIAISKSSMLSVFRQTRNMWLGTSTAWGNAINWAGGYVPLTDTDVYIDTASANNMPVVSDASRLCRNLVIGNGASLTLNNSASQLSISGTFTNNGTFTISNGELTFNGTASQTIPAGTYKKITINNASNVSLAGNVSMSGDLTMTSGKLFLGAYNLTMTGSSSDVVNASSSKYVVTDGTGCLQIQNIGSTAFTRNGNVSFPVGPSASSYNPVVIYNAGTSDAYSVRVVSGISSAYSGTSPSGTTLTSNAVNRTWHISESTSGGSNVALTLQWNSSDELSGFSRSSCYVGHYTGGAWDMPGGAAASGSGPYTRSRSGITSFSPFGIGEGGTPLPVDLLSFDARPEGAHVKLNWQTASEVNNHHFTIDRSRDLKNIEEIAEVPGAGNSLKPLNYETLDRNPYPGLSYYRLKQTDLDGQVEYFEWKAVNRSIATLSGMNMYPNPLTGNKIHVTLNGEKTIVFIRLIDQRGRMIVEQNFKGQSAVEMDLEKLDPGMYIMQVGSDSGILAKKMIRQ